MAKKFGKIINRYNKESGTHHALELEWASDYDEIFRLNLGFAIRDNNTGGGHSTVVKVDRKEAAKLRRLLGKAIKKYDKVMASATRLNQN